MIGGKLEMKSFKHHLKKIVRNSQITLEQILTVTAQIEGIYFRLFKERNQKFDEIVYFSFRDTFLEISWKM